MTNEPQKVLEPIARFTIKDASRLTPEGVKEVATWLRAQAKFLAKEAPKFSKRFTARFYY